MIACATGCMSKEAKQAQNKINSLPDSFSDGILSDLQEVSAEYEALAREDKFRQ